MEGNALRKEDFEACMVLAAAGDAMGYKNGSWEFNYSSTLIHKEMMEMTQGKGPLYLKIGMDWRYSDDTVMHLATALALVDSKQSESVEVIAQRIAKQYKICSKKMGGRAPGKTCMKTLSIIDDKATNWNKIPYSELKGGGCGASMRSACIGLFLHSNTEKLVALAIQSGRITHHNPVGYLGAVVSAYFTSLALKKVEPHGWVALLFEQVFSLSKKHITEVGREVNGNLNSGQWAKFEKAWLEYAQARNLSIHSDALTKPVFPEKYGLIEREHFYKKLAWNGWPGALGIDSVLIAYDAFLGCEGSWEQFCLRGILHGGDNDSTGTIGGAWFGAFYGFKGVPKCHYEQLQDNKKLRVLGQRLYLQSK